MSWLIYLFIENSNICLFLNIFLFCFVLYAFLFKQNSNDTNSSELEIARSGMWKLRNPCCQIRLRTPICESSPRLGNRETRAGTANRTVLLKERPAGAERPRGQLLAMLTVPRVHPRELTAGMLHSQTATNIIAGVPTREVTRAGNNRTSIILLASHKDR